MVNNNCMSKKIVQILLLSLSVILFSCKDTSSPKAIAEVFLFSLRTLDIEKAKTVSTKNTWDLLNIMESTASQISEEQKKELGDNLKIKITNVHEESDSTVIITYTSTPKFLPFNKIRMLKTFDQNGRIRWKVDISTIDIVENDELILEQENKSIFEDEPIMDDTSQNTNSENTNK